MIKRTWTQYERKTNLREDFENLESQILKINIKIKKKRKYH
jgi:hypothetical protein